ncbi:hypothetical protein BH09BAC4_BH09BAC4_22930 [soil metagenome]
MKILRLFLYRIVKIKEYLLHFRKAGFGKSYDTTTSNA